MVKRNVSLMREHAGWRNGGDKLSSLVLILLLRSYGTAKVIGRLILLYSMDIAAGPHL